MSGGQVTPQFIEGGSGRIFTLMRRPEAPRGGVLIVPPFAEEMNKSRRMFTDLALALAGRGIATVLPDLYGTGDSEGEFHDADWTSWVRDVVQTAGWAHAQGCPIVAILGLRTGCLLAAQAASALHGVERSVFWQPVNDGGRFLTQFLRLGVAAAMMDGGGTSAAELREEIRRGGRAEVAGYGISARLADQLEALRLETEMSPALGELCWMEIVRDAQSGFPVASQRIVDSAREAGVRITTRAIAGEPFWLATEIVRSAALVDATADALAPPT